MRPLYKVPNRTYIRIVDGEPKSPPATPVLEQGDCLFFEHVDGMYSYCKDVDGNVVHLAAWTEVDIVDPQPEW